jgi:hypothetical protein
VINPVPLFGMGLGGKSRNVSDQLLTNLYREIQPEGEKYRMAIYPTPGLALFTTFGAEPIRGLWQVGSIIYVVSRNRLYSLDNAGTQTALGTLVTSTGRVDMSDNGTQVIIVDGPNGYTYNITTTTFAQISDVDFPGADTVTFLAGFFIVSAPDSGQFYISGLYDGTTWDALDFATAESNPDDLIRVFADGGQLMLFGDKTVESWGNSGAADFPFAIIAGSASEWGLAARWSLAKFDNSVMFLRKNRLGQVQVAKQAGYQSVAVSTPELDNRINAYSATADATAFSYMLDGHSFYQINFPTANESWLYDGLSNAWQKVQSGSGRHRAEMQTNLLAKSYVADYANGNIYLFSDDEYTDNGASIPREIVCRHVMTGNWSVFEELWIEMEAGVGLSIGQGSNPQIMMQVSKDGGHTWGNELWVPFGKIGEYRKRAVWRRLGRSRDWLFRFRVTDPVNTVFVNAWGRIGG